MRGIDGDSGRGRHIEYETHCTIGWRAAGLLAIERHLFHGASRDEAMEIAAAAHMSHASGDVEDWMEANDQGPGL